MLDRAIGFTAIFGPPAIILAVIMFGDWSRLHNLLFSVAQ